MVIYGNGHYGLDISSLTVWTLAPLCVITPAVLFVGLHYTYQHQRLLIGGCRRCFRILRGEDSACRVLGDGSHTLTHTHTMKILTVTKHMMTDQQRSGLTCTTYIHPLL